MLVKSNKRLEEAIDYSSFIKEDVATFALKKIGFDERLFDATKIVYISPDENKIIDCTEQTEFIWLVSMLLTNNAYLVGYSKTSEFKHLYTVALSHEENTHDGWYDVKYVYIEFETSKSIPISPIGEILSYVDITPQSHKITAEAETIKEAIKISENDPVDKCLFEIVGNSAIIHKDDRGMSMPRTLFTDNPDEVLAHVLASKIRKQDWAWKFDSENDTSITLSKDNQRIIISKNTNSIAAFNDSSYNATCSCELENYGNIFPVVKAFGYVFSEPGQSMYRIRSMFNMYYIRRLADMYNDEIEQIAGMRGAIRGIQKESPYCYKLWNDSGESVLIENKTSPCIYLIKSLLDYDYTISDISEGMVYLEKDGIEVKIAAVVTSDGVDLCTITAYGGMIPLQPVHTIASGLGIRPVYVRADSYIKKESEEQMDCKQSLRKCLRKISENGPIVADGDGLNDFLELKYLLNNYNKLITGKFLDNRWKETNRWFSQEKVSELLMCSKLPYKIEIDKSDDKIITVRVLKTDRIDEDDSNPTEEEDLEDLFDYNSGDKEDTDYNSIL